MTLNLHQQALSLAANYQKSERELLKILDLIDEDKTYLAFGVSSLFRYCVEILKLSEYDTSKFIQVSRKSKEVPLFKEAIETGELSITKGSRIASVITPATQNFWIETAKSSTHRELEREVAKLNPKPQIKERIKVLSPEYSELRLNISKELETKFRRAQEVLRTHNLEQTLESLVDLALKQKDPIQKAERAEAKKQTKSTADIQPSTCNAPKNAVNRSIPSSLKHQVSLRDRGRCTYKNCNATRYTEVHHIILISRGGKHTLDNLTTLCSAHHSMMHGFSKRKFG